MTKHGLLYERFEETKWVKSRKSQDRQHNGLELEDTKGVIKSRKLQDRQHNGLELEDTQGVIKSINSRTGNTMATRYQRGNQKP
jgi:hypothetical protein